MTRQARKLLAVAVAVMALSLACTSLRASSAERAGGAGVARSTTTRPTHPASSATTGGRSGGTGAGQLPGVAGIGGPGWTPGEDGPSGLGGVRPGAGGSPTGSPGTSSGTTPGRASGTTGSTTAGPGSAGSGAAGSGADAGRAGSASGCPASTGTPLHTAPGAGRTIALTFDDGPGPTTGAVLDVLAARHVHATFFVVGAAVAADPGDVRRAAAEGNLIGNHTWDHAYPRSVRHGWTVPYLADQVNRTDAAVVAATGRPTCFFRPPGGFMPASVGVTGRQSRQQVVLWSVDPRDWAVQGAHDPGPAGRAREADRIYQAAIAGASQPHPILLLHDSGGYRGATAAALPRIIAFYQAHGYRFVRLDGRS